MVITGRVSRRKQEKCFLLFLFFYTLIIQGLMSLLNLPQAVLYVKDVVLMLCVLIHLYRYRMRQLGILQILSLALLTLCLASSVAGKVPVFTSLIAVRKLFRGFVYMALCKEYLSMADADDAIQVCYKLQWINFILIAIQRFALGFHQDYSNGIFGTGLTNNFTSVFCIILVCYCTSEYYHKRCGVEKWIGQLILNYAIATVAELKVLFLLLPASIAVIYRKKLFSKKGVKLALLLVVVFVVSIIIFGTMYQDQVSSIITISGMRNYNNWGLATHALVDRKNWLQYTVKYIFSDNVIKNMIGIGFGTVSGLPSSTMDNYGYRALGYGSYTASMLFLESGFSGLILIVIWFVANLKRAFKKPSDKMMRMFADFEKGFILSMAVFLVYANILFNDSSYMVFFALSFMYMKK